MSKSTAISSFSLSSFISGSLMVFGTSVGAGMLGIPLMTAEGGFGNALFVTFLVWLFMAATGLLLLEATLRMPQGANFISLSSKLLGRGGKWITVAFFLFLYYAFLVAYFSGGAPLLGDVFTKCGFELFKGAPLFAFAAIFGGVVALGPKVIHKTNAILSVCMLVAFCALVFVGSQCVEQKRLLNQTAPLSFGAIPVLFGAFGFHNVVPSLATSLRGDKKALRGAVLLGTFLAFALYSLWQWLVLGSLSKEALAEVLHKDLPVTYALAKASSQQVYTYGQVFAFAALTTSFLGVSFSLVDFIQEGLCLLKKKACPRFVSVVLALVPPLICVVYHPHLFDRALGVAGGFGEALLNGILPTLFFWKMKALVQERLGLKVNLFLGALILFSLWAMFIEIRHLLF